MMTSNRPGVSGRMRLAMALRSVSSNPSVISTNAPTDAARASALACTPPGIIGLRERAMPARAIWSGRAMGIWRRRALLKRNQSGRSPSLSTIQSMEFEEGSAVLPKRSRPRRLRQNLSPREELVLMRLKKLVPHDQARGEVHQKSDWPLRIGDDLPERGGKQVETCGRDALRRVSGRGGTGPHHCRLARKGMGPSESRSSAHTPPHADIRSR
jgi:hypothetical protein